ncbi:hypothetical protein DTO164E3_1996 [Paecilomyces variotii]|nr:hypothetical protein DTO164E3_1996 [Paecilomyces variotii]
MTPSLILGLIASFFSVPFVVLHTLIAWNYKKSSGTTIPRTPIHIVCSHLPRLMVVIWLATTVTGLVVISKQPTCDASQLTRSFWRSGTSCVLHRVAVIIAILALITALALLCSIELSLRRYDASLLGLYTPQRPSRDGSIFSESSWESDTLKSEILFLCRHPDGAPGNRELYWSNGKQCVSEKPVRPPSMRYPAPVRPKPQLRLNTDPGSIRPEIVRASSASPSQSSQNGSPVNQPTNEGAGSTENRAPAVSRTGTIMTAHPNDSVVTVPSIAELSGVPEIPAIPPRYKQQHVRQESSVSSQNKFLPNVWQTNSTPLSEDPLIKAISSPDLAKQALMALFSESDTSKVVVTEPLPVAAPANSSQAVPKSTNHDMKSSEATPAPPRPRAMTASPGNPPPVLPPQPLTVRKSRSSYIAPIPRSIHHPHHPNYVPPPPPPIRSSQPRPQPAESERPRRHNTRRISKNYQFERSQVPHHTQSHRYHYQQDPRRYNPNLHSYHQSPRAPRFNPSHALPPIPRSDDVEIVYPSTRRPRSSTYGGIGLPKDGLGSMKAGARSSINLSTPGAFSTGEAGGIDSRTYRGAQRTSMHGGY